VLIDLLLSDGQALETFDQIFQAAPHVPILVFSNPEHEDVAKQAVQRGAQDYILDDRLDSYSLSKALHNMLERTAHAEALFARGQVIETDSVIRIYQRIPAGELMPLVRSRR
jgi:DNA-binding NarL/FixJ family response regulator